MGNFFTTMQIYDDEKMSQEQFIDKFCREICDEGYVACGSDESELSYILKFADNCQWVTVTSEDYKDDMDLPRKDVVRIAKMLGTACVQTTVIDSDCAVMELYNAKGEQADMFVIGRADDYFGDNIPQPKESIWKPFLTESTSWDDFNNLKNGDYVFVEDGLSELAPVIGMDSRNIVLEVDEAVEDEQTVFLYFRKADAKKEKKLTLNAAFKQVFGEALEPLGFVKIKSKHPYYVRVVNGEILHVITFAKDSYYKDKFDIYAGVATVYRPLLDFDQNIDYNTAWMSPVRFYELNYAYSCDNCGIYYEYEVDNNNSIIKAFTKALKQTKKFIIPVLDPIITIKDVIDYFNIYCGSAIYIYSAKDMYEYNRDNNEALLYFKLNDHSDLKSESEKSIEHTVHLIKCGLSKMEIDVVYKKRENSRKEMVANRDSIYNDSNILNKVILEISQNQTINQKKLKHYGLLIN